MKPTAKCISGYNFVQALQNKNKRNLHYIIREILISYINAHNVYTRKVSLVDFCTNVQMQKLFLSKSVLLSLYFNACFPF